MDPWLEGEEVFPNLHDRLTISLQDALNASLPPGYVATTKNRVWVDPELQWEPDVAVFGCDRNPDGQPGGAATLLGLVAIGQQRVSDPLEEPYLEILSASGKRLVTAVEVISLTNKRAGEKGRKTYQQKQEEYRLANVNLVEIDLLRRGPHVTATPLPRLQKVLGAFDYHVSVVTSGDVVSYHGAGIRLADRLPAIGIPLGPGVPAVTVDLQPMLDLAYDRSRYTMFFSYREPPNPPLTPEQQTWAEGILRAKGWIP